MVNGQLCLMEEHSVLLADQSTDGPYYAIIEFNSLNVTPTFLNTYKSGPTTMLTFDQQPLNESLASGNSSYTWMSEYNGLSGVAYFNGVNQSINLMSYAEPGNSPLPPVIGGAVSFEGWIACEQFQNYLVGLIWEDMYGKTMALGDGDNEISGS